MPRYDYRCLECEQTFEVTHSISAGPLKKCILCSGDSVRKLISSPMINTIKSGSPTGAKYEKMTTKEVKDAEAPHLLAVEKQEGMKEKLEIMYSGKLD